ncbi:MAG: adenylate/guanylate cyclase domain-containing protein [Actinomycetota bacterium]
MDSVSERFADRELLMRLLNEYNEHPGERERISKEIGERFGRRIAVLVLDSSGFTRTVQEGGIIPFLALLERLQRLVRPAIERTGGQILKTEADNVFAVYDSAEAAVGGAEEIRSHLRTVNDALPGDEEIYVSIAIGFGELLLVGAEDVFGDEMNLACKLGEDLAQRDEILLTPAAHEAVGATNRAFDELRFSVSGVELPAYRLAADPS